MMTYDLLVDWVRSVMVADAALVALVNGANNLKRADEELPSKTGVYIQVPAEAPASRWASAVELNLHVYTTGGGLSCDNIVRAVHNLFDCEPGLPRDWNPTPASKGLRISHVMLQQIVAPQRDGEASQGFAAMLSLTVKCSAA